MARACVEDVAAGSVAAVEYSWTKVTRSAYPLWRAAPSRRGSVKVEHLRGIVKPTAHEGASGRPCRPAGGLSWAVGLAILVLLATTATADQLYFFVNSETPTVVDPGALVRWRMVLRNTQAEAVRNVTMHFPLPPGSTVVSVVPESSVWTCTTDASSIDCIRDVLPAGDFSTDVGVRISLALSTDIKGSVFNGIGSASAPEGTRFIQSTASVQAITYAQFYVRSTADSGPGSLRAIIEETNGHCTGTIPCKLFVDVPRYSTIAPETPLPAITSCAVSMRGNPHIEGDRRLELSGAKLAEGNGLHFRACSAGWFLDDLAINDFPDYGILIDEPTGVLHLSGLFVGTDITGKVARPNGRGIGGFHGRSYTNVFESVISHNRRSGVFAWDANVSLIDSVVSHNGASGVFAGLQWVSISGGEIAHNGEFGIAISRAAANFSLAGGSIHSNGITGIDWNLDGPWQEGSDPRIPPPPVITEAVYEPATNNTVVTGRFAKTSVIGPLRGVQLYASQSLNARGYAEGERAVGVSFSVEEQEDGSFTFRGVVAGDLRGQIVTATVGSALYLDATLGHTTEFSAGVTVR